MVKCASCGATQFKELYKNEDYISGEIFPIEQCLHCNLVRTGLSVNSKTQDQSYYHSTKYYGWGGAKFNYLVEYLIKLSRYFRARYITKFCPRSGNILDIGCGRGLVLKILRNRGWSVWGSEMTNFSATYARKVLKIKVVVADNFSEYDFPDNFFDVVTLYHVLEHLHNPIGSLKEIERMLKPGGLCIIEVPNIHSIQSILSKGKWFHLDTPRHIHHFSTNSLVVILRRLDFEIIKTSTHSFEYGYFGMIQSLLNLSSTKMNLLYSLLKIRPGDFHPQKNTDLFKTIIKLFPVIILSMPLEMVASLFKKGSVVRLVIRKNV